MSVWRPVCDPPGTGKFEPHGPPEPLFLADWLDRQFLVRGARGQRTRQIRRIPFYGDWVPIVLTCGLVFVSVFPYGWVSQLEFIQTDPLRVMLQLWYLLVALMLGIRIAWTRRLLFELEVRSDERRQTWQRLLERQTMRKVGWARAYVTRRVNLIAAIVSSTFLIGFVSLYWPSVRADIAYLWNGFAGLSSGARPGGISEPDILFAMAMLFTADWIVFLTHLFLRKPTV